MWMNTFQATKPSAILRGVITECDPLSHPYYKWTRYANRQKAEDIEGTRSLSFYGRHNLNRPRDLSLTTEDIEGAKPRSRSFKTKRCTNPLNPEYKLASVQIPPQLDKPSKQGGLPTNFVADIEKSGPRPLFQQSTKDSMNTSDIAYTEPNHFRRKVRPLPRNIQNPFDVKDINAGSYSNKGQRHTNPLDPIYSISLSCGEISPDENKTIGPIDGSKPKKILKNPIPPSLPIEKSLPQMYIGAVPYSIFDRPAETRPLPTGSRASTLKKGLVSRRKTDPINPQYNCLEGKLDSSCEILNKCKVNYR